MANTTDNGKVQELLARSAVDSEFRTALLTDPRTALEQAAGKQIPENLRVKFIENLHEYRRNMLIKLDF